MHDIEGDRIIKLTAKEVFQRFPTTLGEVKAKKTSKNSPNEIWQIIYSGCRVKEVTNKIDTNIMYSIQI